MPVVVSAFCLAAHSGTIPLCSSRMDTNCMNIYIFCWGGVISSLVCLVQLRDWSLITGRGGYKMGKSRVRNFLRPPPSRQGKIFRAPPFKEWKLFAPPLQYGYNFKLPCKNYPKTCCAPPSAWLKLFAPPLFVGVKLHVPPPPVL